MSADFDLERMRSVVAVVGEDRYRALTADLARQLGELAARLAAGEAPADVARQAHRMRGGAASLGATAVADALTQIERAADSGTPGAEWGYRLSDMARDLESPRHAHPTGTNR